MTRPLPPDLPLIVPASALADAKVRELVAALVTQLREHEPEAPTGPSAPPLDLSKLTLPDALGAPGVTATRALSAGTPGSELTAHYVTRDEPIAGFTERRTHKEYIPGQTYYPLLAVEHVRADREIILEHVRSGARLVGSGVRQLIGLPPGDCDVDPGVTGEWHVYVQSGSPNRKLRRGTWVLIDHGRHTPITPTWTPKAPAAAGV